MQGTKHRWPLVGFVSVLPGVVLAHYSRTVTGMLQKRLGHGVGQGLFCWRSCGEVVLHSSIREFGFWVRGVLSQSPLGQENRFVYCFLFTCETRNESFRRWDEGDREEAKTLGCTDWGEGHLAGREEPPYWILLPQLLMSFCLTELYKMQAYTYTFFFHCSTLLKFVSEKNILSIILNKILAAYCNIRDLHIKNDLILETTEN